MPDWKDFSWVRQQTVIEPLAKLAKRVFQLKNEVMELFPNTAQFAAARGATYPLGFNVPLEMLVRGRLSTEYVMGIGPENRGILCFK